MQEKLEKVSRSLHHFEQQYVYSFHFKGKVIYPKYLKAILPETSPFLSAQMAMLSSFFQCL